MGSWTAREWNRVEEELEEFRQANRPDERELPSELREMLHCIHEHLFDPKLSVKTLKSRCGIRDNNVSLRFRWQMGQTIRGYIESLRLRAARRLLKTSECGVFDVALLVGYNHPQTFYRAFERSFNCTPGAYRQRLRERVAETSVATWR